jgi:hypothetical protein
MSDSNRSAIMFNCGICGAVVEKADPDGYTLQVRRFGAKGWEMIWEHGACLRKAMPVVSEEIPGNGR